MATENNAPERKRKTMRVTMTALLNVAEAVKKNGLSEEFVAACASRRLFLTVKIEDKDFVKSFLAERDAGKAKIALTAVKESKGCTKY